MPGNMMGGGRYDLVGDPGVLGAIGGALKFVGKKILPKAAGFIPGVGPIISGIATAATVAPLAKAGVKLIGRGATSGALTRTAVLQTAPAVAGGVAARMGGVGARALTLGGAAAAGGLAAGLLPGMRGGRRIRRMNALNPKALKRATRRLSAFHQFSVSTAAELRKLAPARARCVPRRKSCRP